MNTCSIDGCEDPTKARQLCAKHYWHSRKNSHGECSYPECHRPVRSVSLCRGHYRQKQDGQTLRPLVTHVRNASLLEKLEARTIKGDGCWIWTGSTSSGYGELTFNGRSIYAHRAWFEVIRGEVPAGMVVDHICHQPLCCNPGHLQAVTPKQNNENRLGANKNSQSGIRGVTFDKRRKRWVGKVGHDSRAYTTSYFDSPDEANRATQALRRELHTNSMMDAV